MDGINGWKAFNTGVLCGSVWKISNVPTFVDKVMDDVVVEQLNEIFRRSDSADFARPVLTEAEREAVAGGIAALDQIGTEWTLELCKRLNGLLSRCATHNT